MMLLLQADVLAAISSRVIKRPSAKTDQRKALAALIDSEGEIRMPLEKALIEQKKREAEIEDAEIELEVL
ncbi:hypothetical protein BN1708_006805 [Verticillium longisporum]|uniref:Uncharacterized protein n=1 Tax=Verticillium longisporum TaxID=100787 RepID=A0A0G4MNK4_VERLO|nr:hypothetical protein BN1708_006805 [Verticillium longisporum]